MVKYKVTGSFLGVNGKRKRSDVTVPVSKSEAERLVSVQKRLNAKARRENKILALKVVQIRDRK